MYILYWRIKYLALILFFANFTLPKRPKISFIRWIMNKMLFLIPLLIITSSCYCQKAEEYFRQSAEKANLEDYPGAIADYSKAIEINSNIAIYYSYWGNTKVSHQDYIGAIIDYTKAIEIDPKFVETYINRGNTKSKSSWLQRCNLRLYSGHKTWPDEFTGI